MKPRSWHRLQAVSAHPTSRQRQIEKSPSTKFVLAAVVAVFALAACGGADLSPTDCNQTEFVVNSFEDINDGACNAGNCTLREAVEAANTCSVHPAYTIVLPQGDYELALRGPGDDRGDLDLKRDMTIKQRDGDRSLPVITGPSSWNDRIFHVHPEVQVNFNDLWVKGGNTDDNGAGILNEGELNIDHAIISENHTSEDGGGLANDGLATLYAVEFYRNFANPAYRTGCGGAVFNRGQLIMDEGTIHEGDAYNGAGICNQSTPGGSLLVRRTYIQDNGGTTAGMGGLGGGISSTGGPVTIEDSTIRDNVAERGGGMYATHGEIHVSGTTITGNRARFGGGVFIGPSATDVRFRGTEISSNRAVRVRDRTGEWDGGLGGGVLLTTNDYDFDQSPILHNTAEGTGGGMYLSGITTSQGYFSHAAIARNYSPNGTGGGIAMPGRGGLLLANATISENWSQDHGSALFIGDGARIRMVHVTMVDNVLDPSGFLPAPIHAEAGAQVTMSNSLALGPLGSGLCTGVANVIRSEGGNMLPHRNACLSNTRTDDGSINPVFRGGENYLPLMEEGGTWVNPLPPTSPAVDFIDSSDCNRDDQRLVSRPQGDGCDSGAYELEMTPLSAEGTAIPFPTIPPPEATGTPTAEAACPAVLTFQGASFGSVSYRQGQGETLVTLDVPADMEQDTYSAAINGKDFSCSQSSDFANRLFCVGPRLVEGVQAELQVFGDGCTDPVYVTTFSVPFPLYPTATPTLKPTATCDPQMQQCP